MRRAASLAAICLLLVGAVAVAGPFPSGAAATARAPDERPAGAPGSRGLLHRVFPSLGGAQRGLARALSETTRALGEHPSPSALALAWVLGLASGALAAAGPGHGKIVIAAFFAARQARAARAIAVAALIALMQVATAAAAVWMLGTLLGRGRAGVLAGADRVELASYSLVALVGLAMAASAASGGAPGDARFRRGDWGLVIATGFIPSAGAIAFLHSAVASGVAGAGAAVALAMASGIAVTLSVVALLGRAARAVALRVAGLDGRVLPWATRGVAVAGWALIAVAGALFSWSAWRSLG